MLLLKFFYLDFAVCCFNMVVVCHTDWGKICVVTQFVVSSILLRILWKQNWKIFSIARLDHIYLILILDARQNLLNKILTSNIKEFNKVWKIKNTVTLWVFYIFVPTLLYNPFFHHFFFKVISFDGRSKTLTKFLSCS